MLKRIARRAILPALLLATAALGGCYVAPYPGYYRPGYAYAGPPVYVGAGYGWRGGYWR